MKERRSAGNYYELVWQPMVLQQERTRNHESDHEFYSQERQLDDIMVAQTGYIGTPEHGPIVDVKLKDSRKCNTFI